jgi:hypothetical protein
MSKKRAAEAISVDVLAPIGVDGDNQPSQSPAAKKPRVKPPNVCASQVRLVRLQPKPLNKVPKRQKTNDT